MAIRRLLALAATLLVAVAVGAPLARADGGPGPGGGDRGERTEARARGACPGGGSWDLRLRGEGGSIELDVRVAAGRRVRAGRWRVVVVHERRIAWRGSPRASSTIAGPACAPRLRRAGRPPRARDPARRRRMRRRGRAAGSPFPSPVIEMAAKIPRGQDAGSPDIWISGRPGHRLAMICRRQIATGRS